MTRTQRPIGLLSVAARLAGLGATLCVLVATSAPVCDRPAAPIAFIATGTCGPGGLVVANVEGFGMVTLANRAALGLPANVSGDYLGGAECPMHLERGGWEISIPSSATGACSGDGGSPTADGEATDAGATPSCATTCTVAPQSSGPLRFVCVDAQNHPVCESTLTVLE